MPVCDIGKSTKLKKRDRNNLDELAFSVTKAFGDQLRERQGQRDCSKTKYYNCGQIRYIKA